MIVILGLKKVGKNFENFLAKIKICVIIHNIKIKTKVYSGIYDFIDKPDKFNLILHFHR